MRRDEKFKRKGNDEREEGKRKEKGCWASRKQTGREGR